VNRDVDLWEALVREPVGPAFSLPLSPCSYDASGPQRNHLLWLLNAIVGLYIVLSLYIIGLYGS
jgi:hypothetical protein